eukprot:3113190-Amphidinium_carterae.2
MEAATLAFLPCVERSIEGRHALVKAKTICMKRLTPCPFSLALRAHEFQRRCLLNPKTAREWEGHVRTLRSHPEPGFPEALLRLGLGAHAECTRSAAADGHLKLKHACRIIYHCDMTTRYDEHEKAARALKKATRKPEHLEADDFQRLLVHSTGSSTVSSGDAADEQEINSMLSALSLQFVREVLKTLAWAERVVGIMLKSNKGANLLRHFNTGVDMWTRFSGMDCALQCAHEIQGVLSQISSEAV